MINLDKDLHKIDIFSADGTSDKYSAVVNGKNVVFKLDYDRPSKGGRIPTSFVEVFVSRILQKVGCKNFLPYQFAKLDGEIGCFSENFKNENFVKELYFMNILCFNYINKQDKKIHCLNEDILNFELYKEMYKVTFYESASYNYSVDFFLEQVQTFCKTYNIYFDQTKIVDCFIEMAVCDYFLSNTDRHSGNISFVLKENNLKEKVLELLPLFDNGMSFNVETINLEKVKEWLYLGISNFPRYEKIQNNKILNDYNIVVADTIQIAQNDNYINSLVENFLKLDIEKELEEFCQEQDVECEPLLKNRIVHNYKSRVADYNFVQRSIERKVKKAEQKFNNTQKDK